jgi:hypothetical protein
LRGSGRASTPASIRRLSHAVITQFPHSSLCGLGH